MSNKKNNIKKLVPVKKDGFLLVLQVPQPTAETNRVMHSSEVGQVGSLSEAPGDAKSALDKLKMLAAARMAKSNKS